MSQSKIGRIVNGMMVQQLVLSSQVHITTFLCRKSVLSKSRTGQFWIHFCLFKKVREGSELGSSV